jgi:dihydrofolate reductase/thymidylate synthase
MKFNIIACADSLNGIGRDGGIPWKITEDMKYFKHITTDAPDGKQNAIIMGRITWESLPKFCLPNRVNIVLSKTTREIHLENDTFNDLYVYRELNSALDYLSNRNDINEIFIIGGESLYRESINHPQCKRIYLTRLVYDFNCDRAFPLVPDSYYVETETEILNHDVSNYQFLVYNRHNSDELQLNNLIHKILEEGNERQTRNSVVKSIFSEKLTFDISESFPLMTCKRVWFKGIFEELIWFIRGDIDSNKLSDKGVNIWKGNSRREYLDSINLTELPSGNCGCVYGYQWRNYNAPFNGEPARGQGIDQLQEVVDLIRNNPTSRRIFMSAWNPCQLNNMCLPPCHISYQFYVSNGTLSCQMYQRSCDVFLGLYFNIASTALLTYLIAKITNLKPGKIHICLGDAHIYQDHIKQCQQILSRNTRSFPTLKIHKDIKELSDIEEMILSDVEIQQYKPHPSIKATMF